MRGAARAWEPGFSFTRRPMHTYQRMTARVATASTIGVASSTIPVDLPWAYIPSTSFDPFSCTRPSVRLRGCQSGWSSTSQSLGKIIGSLDLWPAHGTWWVIGLRAISVKASRSTKTFCCTQGLRSSCHPSAPECLARLPGGSWDGARSGTRAIQNSTRCSRMTEARRFSWQLRSRSGKHRWVTIGSGRRLSWTSPASIGRSPVWCPGSCPARTLPVQGR
mmetsp:Transcript_31937/g.76084  ORF Transcript_31937/g.76084 Transcript_31937/m.76084 type:complete len:220 (-) Transcript_31937:358-1017(-)